MCDIRDSMTASAKGFDGLSTRRNISSSFISDIYIDYIWPVTAAVAAVASRHGNLTSVFVFWFVSRFDLH